MKNIRRLSRSRNKKLFREEKIIFNYNQINLKQKKKKSSSKKQKNKDEID